jgi:hypothetical protein
LAALALAAPAVSAQAGPILYASQDPRIAEVRQGVAPGSQENQRIERAFVGDWIYRHEIAQATVGFRWTSVRIQADGGYWDVPATPTIVSPLNGAVFQAPANIPLSAAASDPDGQVVQVEFHANGGLVGTDTVAPFSLVWQNVPAGSYTLTAKATDNDGGVKTSAGVPITVQ